MRSSITLKMIDSGIFLFVVAALLIVSPRAQAVDCESSVISTERVVGFSGCISDEAESAFVAAIGRETDLIVLRSTGGSVPAALRMAKTISAKSLRVIVRGICLSSCANYLMPAASSVSVEQDSIVGFHGDARLTSMNRAGIERNNQELWAAVERIAEEEAEFSTATSRASLVHSAQSVALAPADDLVSIRLDEKNLLCRGQGLAPWFPTLLVLKELRIIDQIVEREEALLPQLPATTPEELVGVSRSSANPLLNCKILPR